MSKVNFLLYGILIGMIIAKSLINYNEKPQYAYMDMNQNIGVSDYCRQISNGMLICETEDSSIVVTKYELIEE